MRNRIICLVSILICLSLLSGNGLPVDAAKLEDKPPEPLGSWSKAWMMSTICKPFEDHADQQFNGKHGTIVCWDGTDHGKVNMGVPQLILSGPNPNYGLVGVPVVYKYEWEDFSSIPVTIVHDEIRSINGRRERYNGLDLYVQIVAYPKVDGDMDGYGNLEFINMEKGDSDNSVFGIIGFNSMPGGTMWDSAIGMSIEGWRNPGGSQGAFQWIDGEIRTESTIMADLGVSQSWGGVSDGRRWGDGKPYYVLTYAPEYFVAVNAVASSYKGSGQRRSTGEPAFQFGINQYWRAYARLHWDSIDRYEYWTEEECHMEPGLYAWSPLVEVCDDVQKEGWLVADTHPYDSGWMIINNGNFFDRTLFVDNTSDGGGRMDTELNIDYYQSQPLLTRD